MLTVHRSPTVVCETGCDRVIDLSRAAPCADARLVRRNRDHNRRRADLVWIMGRIIDILSEANRDSYRFDPDGVDASAQIARCGAVRQGHFDWHCGNSDRTRTARRKLTMVIQLSAPSNEPGGRLEIMPRRSRSGPRPRAAPPRFSRVTRCIALRRSLTIGAHGPAVR
ncbi:PKHD-type hydroxylase [Salipiger aestuarii]|uniref:PKHD-type hydroxylase n=1 Tax=Salipiger aestuarii TaxID=568098 RepID=A0A327YCX9_9RHOB|nr:2OG-Fe(II) oxygenase [Salipiger aestuarii]RAK18341.1 PKHD-type hydroxylase [Salipiger aestuarii]